MYTRTQINKINKIKLSLHLPYNLAIILGGMDPREMKIYTHRKTRT